MKEGVVLVLLLLLLSLLSVEHFFSLLLFPFLLFRGLDAPFSSYQLSTYLAITLSFLIQLPFCSVRSSNDGKYGA